MIFLEALKETGIDSIKLLPFLFLTYLLMEYIENRTSDQTKQVMRRSGKWGPVLGSVLGAVPQCGFSAAAANLYAGRVITMGTLIAVFLSTSDEMLPVFLSEAVPFPVIGKIILLKVVVGLLAGFLVDLTINRKSFWAVIHRKGDLRKNNPFQIKEMCAVQKCNCAGSLLKPALSHTLQVFLFLFLISFALELMIEGIGEESLKGFVMNEPIIGELLAGVIGLIPNCAASVVLTELYLEGAMSISALLSGLFVGAGVGLLVLFRVNKNRKDNLRILLTLYGLGVGFGILLGALQVGIFF